MQGATNKYNINDKVITPDGLGIVKRIELVYSEAISYVCVLEKPYKIENPFDGSKVFGFPPFSFGYAYLEELLHY